MKYIMIGAAYISGVGSTGVIPLVAEFNTKEACEIALAKVKEEFGTREGVCVAKGEEK